MQWLRSVHSEPRNSDYSNATWNANFANSNFCGRIGKIAFARQVAHAGSSLQSAAYGCRIGGARLTISWIDEDSSRAAALIWIPLSSLS